MTIQVLSPVTLDDVDLIVDVLLDQAHHLSGADASAQLARVAATAAKLSAYRVSLVSTIESSQVWRESDPNATAASFLRHEHVVDQREAKADLRAAHSFTRFPELERACRDGALSREKMDLIVSIGLRTEPREAVFGEFVALFVDLAQRLTLSQLRRALDMWADQVDPVTLARDDHDAHQRRELHIHHLGDGIKLDAFFGKEQGMRVMAALNGALDQQYRSRKPAAATDTSGVTTADNVAASTGAQRADAFINAIINPVLASGLLPICGGTPATVCVTVPFDRLQTPGQPADSTDVATRMSQNTMRHHSATIRATNGPGDALISPHTVLQVSCDATIQRVLITPAGKPLDIGRRTRVIPEHIRTALAIRDGGCRFPHCDRPIGWTEGHHIQHWSHGGPTSLDNLVLLCSKHHHYIHAHNIPITVDTNGAPHIHLNHHPKRC